jgi:hypothetical protein
MVRKRMPVLVMLAIVVAALMPGIAAAQAAQTEIRLGRQATLVGDNFFSDQIIVEFTYQCSGPFGQVFAEASQTTPSGTVTGVSPVPAPVTCDGQQHKDGIAVSTSTFLVGKRGQLRLR